MVVSAKGGQLWIMSDDQNSRTSGRCLANLSGHQAQIAAVEAAGGFVQHQEPGRGQLPHGHHQPLPVSMVSR